MKIEKFNESNSNTYYRLFVYALDEPTQWGDDFDTVKEAIDLLKYIIVNGLPGLDGKTYHIHDAYIEKVTRVKSDEVKILINSKKYNI